MGNGAALVAQYVLAQVRALSQQAITPEALSTAWGEAKTYIDDRVASDRVAWRSLMRRSNNPRVAEQADTCARLNPLQAQLMQEMRQQLLTAPSGLATTR
jgi:hypothetical protein